MSKVSVTYHAAEGDSKVCEWGGYTFFDGRVTEIEDNDANRALLDKMRTNRYFTVKGGTTTLQPPAAAPAPKPSPEPEVFPPEEPEETAPSEDPVDQDDEEKENKAPVARRRHRGHG